MTMVILVCTLHSIRTLPPEMTMFYWKNPGPHKSSCNYCDTAWLQIGVGLFCSSPFVAIAGNLFQWGFTTFLPDFCRNLFLWNRVFRLRVVSLLCTLHVLETTSRISGIGFKGYRLVRTKTLRNHPQTQYCIGRNGYHLDSEMECKVKYPLMFWCLSRSTRSGLHSKTRLCVIPRSGAENI